MLQTAELIFYLIFRGKLAAWGRGEGGDYKQTNTVEGQPGIINLLDKFSFVTKTLRGEDDFIACRGEFLLEDRTRPGRQVGHYYCSPALTLLSSPVLLSLSPPQSSTTNNYSPPLLCYNIRPGPAD